jgi:large subunit ribosomal protein L29
MKIKDLRNLTKEELVQKAKDLKSELYKMNMQRFAGSVEKPHLFRQMRKDIARIETLMHSVEKK